ncbi:MAG: glycosyltransferase family protein [Nanoarchaeota archaeon]|nr:glycosyltransferase family protein [Nanoarchaeota archaeon]
MRILYGVCGEGLGHSSRAIEIISHLHKKGHKVLVLTYGQAYEVLKKFPSIKIEGIPLVFENGKLSLTKTFLKNIQTTLTDLSNWKPIKSKIDKFSPQICISDMELLTPIISYWYNLPLISLDNQHLLTNTNIKIPKEYLLSSTLAKLTINTCVSKADAFIVTSFTKTKPSKEKTFIVSPILRKEIINLKPIKQNKVLIYLTKPSENLIKIFSSIPENFIVYSPFIKKNEKIKNILLKKPSTSFLKDLSTCKAVIASAGFSLISEAIYLKKPYFALPLKGQFEQTFNALYLKKSGLGDYSENPSKIQIQNFLNNLSKYEKALNKNKFNPEEPLKVLDRIIKNYEMLI